MTKDICLSKGNYPKQVLLIKDLGNASVECGKCIFGPRTTKDHIPHCEEKPVPCVRHIFGKKVTFHFIDANS